MAGEDEKLQSPEQCDGVLKRAANGWKDDKISANK